MLHFPRKIGRELGNEALNKKNQVKENEGLGLKEVELKLVSELMKNSRKSDRQLARAIGTSQPTVTRIRSRLEKEGYIKEYTMIPDFGKLGYHLLGLTFVKLKKMLDPVEIEKARQITRESIVENRFGIVMLERGLGLRYDGVIMAFYKDYSDYSEHKKALKEYSFLELGDIEGFLISMDDIVHYRPLTFAGLAKQLLTAAEESKK
jgi:DNA-binding Lrp family transcriptional regulator